MRNLLWNISIAAMAVWMFTLSLCVLPKIAQADILLESWRSESIKVRKLAENDAPLAHQEALRLLKNIPAKATPADNAQVLNLLARVEVYTAQVEDSANHSKQALEIAKLNGDRVGQAEAYLNISLNSVNQANIGSLIDAAPRAMEVLQGVDRPDLLGEAMLRVAMMYRRVGQMDESVTLCMQAMDIAKRSKDPMALLYAAQCLGLSFDQSDHHAEARVYYTQMRDLAKTIQAKQLEADAIGGIAASASNMGEWRMAISLQREAIALYREAGVPFNIAHGLYMLAANLRQHGLLDESLRPFSEALAIYEHSPNKIGMWWTLNALSKSYQAMGRMAPALTDAGRAYALAKNIGLLLYRSESAKRMAAVEAAMGDHKRAYQFFAEADDLAEQISREKSSGRMLELAQRYQNESKQKTIDELNLREQQRALERHWLLTILGGSLILLAGSAYFLLRLRRSQHLLEASNEQLRQSQEEISALNVSLECRVQTRTAELRQQTRYLRTLIDALPVSIWLKDTQGRYLAVNASRHATSSPARKGYAPEQMIGKTDEELWPDDSRQFFRVTDSEVMQTRQQKSYEIEIPGEDGSIAWREVDKAPVIDEDGSVLGTVGFARDISERKRYEQALLERAEIERRQSQYFAMVSGIFATVLKRADGSYSIPFISDAVRDLYGLEPDAVMRDIMVFAALAHPDDAEMTFRKADESARDLIPYQVEYRINHPRKGVRWIECRSTPQRMPDGGARWDGFYFDITDRKNTEEALHESRQMLTEAQRIAHVGSWELNLLDNILSWSDEIYRIFEVDPQRFSVSYETFMHTVHPDDRELLDSAYKASLEKRERFEMEHRLLLPDGRIKYVFECCESYFDESGKALRSLGTMQDITERKLMEQAIVAREQQLRALAESSPGMMGAFYARPDGSICMPYVSANIEALFGLRPQDVIDDAAPLLALNHPDDTQRIKDSIAESARTMGIWHEEFRILHPTKGKRWMESNTKPEQHPEGGIVWYGYVHDITERKRMEKALLSREHDFRTLAENAPDNIVRYDRDGRITYLNPPLEKILGRTAAELIGTHPRDNHPDGNFEAYIKMLEGVLAGGESRDIEQILSDGKGGRRIHHVRMVPERNEAGELTGVLAIGRDMTEIFRMQEAIAAREQQFRALVEQAPEPIFRYAPDGLRIYVNAAVERITGLPAGELLGGQSSDGEVVSANDGFASIALVRRICETGEPGEIEAEYEDADGRHRYFHNRLAPEFGADGKVKSVFAICHDVTERKRMEADLRASRNFLDSVIDSVSDPIFVKDRQHRWTLLNDAFCAFIGHSREKLLGKSDYDFFPKEQADEFWAKDEFVFESGRVNLNEERFTTARGVEHYIQTKKTPFVSGDGRPMLVGVIRDITDYKHYEKAREAALAESIRLAKTRSEFLAHMSHELRTPLNGILGYTQILQRDKALGVRNADALRVIQQSGEHLLALVEDILDLARIEAGRFNLDLSDFAFANFLRVVTDIVSVRAREKSLEFFCAFARDLPAGIRGDEKRLRQVLLNLLSNAVKFTDHGRVVLHVGRAGKSRLKFVIEDSGIGIAASEFETIFQPFEQSGDVQKNFGGSGLGLSISRQLVRLMGGDIAVESTLGKGSSFRFELELPEVELASASLLPQPSEIDYAQSKDNEDVAGALVLPPIEEMQTLLRLAQLGNMRDIVQFAERIAGMGAGYQPFAKRLLRMAEGFQSKAILAFAERYSHDTKN